MGYDSILTSDLRLATTSKYVSGDVYKSYWPADAGVNQQTGKTNSRLAVKRCTGRETSFLQCPMEDWWGFDTAGHALKKNISDVFGVSQVYGAGKAIKQVYIPYDDPRSRRPPRATKKTIRNQKACP